MARRSPECHITEARINLLRLGKWSVNDTGNRMRITTMSYMESSTLRLLFTLAWRSQLKVNRRQRSFQNRRLCLKTGQRRLNCGCVLTTRVYSTASHFAFWSKAFWCSPGVTLVVYPTATKILHLLHHIANRQGLIDDKTRSTLRLFYDCWCQRVTMHISSRYLAQVIKWRCLSTQSRWHWRKQRGRGLLLELQEDSYH